MSLLFPERLYYESTAKTMFRKENNIRAVNVSSK